MRKAREGGARPGVSCICRRRFEVRVACAVGRVPRMYCKCYIEAECAQPLVAHIFQLRSHFHVAIR